MTVTSSSQCLATLVAAPASGQGKTLYCAALARYWTTRGKRVQIFKIGPDYLDPSILQQASGQPVYNLDIWIMGEAHCRALLASAARNNDLILVEGLMGLHDNHPSNAQLAKLFGLPVTLVIDVAKFAQTAAAVVNGLSNYGVGVKIASVIGNKVGSDHHHNLMQETIGARYAGSIRRDPRMDLPHRHLGLVQAEDIDQIDQRLDQAAEALAAFGVSSMFEPVDFPVPASPQCGQFPERLLSGRTIAIARDAAFSFIYPANLDLLQALGAQLEFFSPLANEPLPSCDALWLPGGYPELYLAELTSARQTRAAIRQHHQQNKPLLAECGGMMYLCQSITDVKGLAGEGVGLFAAGCRMQSRFQSVGPQSIDYGSGEIRGHSFHHSTIETAVSPERYAVCQDARQGEAVYREGNMTLGYIHHYFTSNPAASAALFL